MILKSEYYSRFHQFDGDCALERFFNTLMGRMQTMRTISSPLMIDTENHDDRIIADSVFADFCRFEIWMHSVVGRLYEWRNSIDEYFTEFEGSWKYYAASKRLEYLREFEMGHDTVKGGLSDEEYESFSIVSQILDDGWLDPAKTSRLVSAICACLASCARVHMPSKIMEFFKDDVMICKLEDGMLKEVTRDEMDLQMASEEVEADDDALRVLAVCGGVQAVLAIIGTLKYNEDNMEALNSARNVVQAILDMDFDTLRYAVAKISKKS